MGSREDVCHCVAVLLDLATDGRVDPLTRAQHVLELVKNDDEPGSMALVEETRHGQSVQERARAVAGRKLHARGQRSTSGTQDRTHRAHRRSEPTGKASTELFAVGALEPLGDVVHREDTEEVHVDADPVVLDLFQHASRERGLAVASRCHETRVASGEGPLHQRCRLRVAVDQVGGDDRAVVREGTSHVL